jgi:hypothetical protein
MEDNSSSDEREDIAHSGKHDLTLRQRDVAAAGWTSFLVAAVGTMLCFAFLDPKILGHAAGIEVDRMTGYAIGFFFFWALAGASAALTLYLARTAHPEQHEVEG